MAQAKGAPSGVTIGLKDLSKVVFDDVGNKIKESGKWPLIIDPAGQSVTFLQYRDTNFLCAMNPGDLTVEKMRTALIGSIRFGKPMVVDMVDVDLYDNVKDAFNGIQPDLFDNLMNKKILEEERYLSLVKKSDGDSYQAHQFSDNFIANFSFIITTKNPSPSSSMVEAMYPIRIE